MYHISALGTINIHATITSVFIVFFPEAARLLNTLLPQMLTWTI